MSFFHEIQCHREYSEACIKLTRLQSIGAEAGKVMNFFMVFSASKLSFFKISFNAHPHSVPELSVQSRGSVFKSSFDHHNIMFWFKCDFNSFLLLIAYVRFLPLFLTLLL